jgi:hypothetical protein
LVLMAVRQPRWILKQLCNADLKSQCGQIQHPAHFT